MHKTRELKHGTRSAYVSRGCRCSECSDANYKYIRAYKDSHQKGKRQMARLKVKSVTIRVSYLVKLEAESEDAALEWMDNQNNIIPDSLSEDVLPNSLAFDLWDEEREEGEEI